jgi:NADPH-dependent 7-cyano-7-deazaguanine reductase QueF
VKDAVNLLRSVDPSYPRVWLVYELLGGGSIRVVAEFSNEEDAKNESVRLNATSSMGNTSFGYVGDQ